MSEAFDGLKSTTRLQAYFFVEQVKPALRRAPFATSERLFAIFVLEAQVPSAPVSPALQWKRIGLDRGCCTKLPGKPSYAIFVFDTESVHAMCAK